MQATYGKTARISHDREKGLKALHTASAWACEHNLVSAQQAAESKSNQITAIPELLKLLEITGAMITPDAMGTQKQIAAQIIDQKGDYSYNQTKEISHHRPEHRQVWVLPIDQLPNLTDAEKWKELATVVMVKRERQLWNKRTTELSF